MKAPDIEVLEDLFSQPQWDYHLCRYLDWCMAGYPDEVMPEGFKRTGKPNTTFVSNASLLPLKSVQFSNDR